MAFDGGDRNELSDAIKKYNTGVTKTILDSPPVDCPTGKGPKKFMEEFNKKNNPNGGRGGYGRGGYKDNRGGYHNGQGQIQSAGNYKESERGRGGYRGRGNRGRGGRGGYGHHHQDQYQYGHDGYKPWGQKPAGTLTELKPIY